jgi:hypothetical protein
MYENPNVMEVEGALLRAGSGPPHEAAGLRTRGLCTASGWLRNQRPLELERLLWPELGIAMLESPDFLPINHIASQIQIPTEQLVPCAEPQSICNAASHGRIGRGLQRRDI